MPVAIPIIEGVVEGGEAVEAAVEAAAEGYEAYRAKKKLDAARKLAAATQAAQAAQEGAQTEACSTCKPLPENPCEHLRTGSGPGKYRGGGHGNPDKNIGTSSPGGDKLDSHHMPSKKSYEGSRLDPEDGPAIKMEPEDHTDTADYGGRGTALRDRQAQQIQEGKFDQAFEESAANVRAIAKGRGDPTRYDQAIKEAKAYKDCLKKNGLLPGMGKNE